ncbi:MAG: phage holin family protein [Sandaracinobacter sp.]
MAGTPDPSIGDAGDRAAAKAAPHRSIVDSLFELFADAGGLVRVEAALARAETAQNLKAVGAQSAKMAAGFALLLMALMFLTVATVIGIAHFIGYLLALLLVTALCVGGGLALLISGKNRLAGQTILPERVLNRMARDLDVIAERAPLPTVPVPPVEQPVDLGAGANAS